MTFKAVVKYDLYAEDGGTSHEFEVEGDTKESVIEQVTTIMMEDVGEVKRFHVDTNWE